MKNKIFEQLKQKYTGVDSELLELYSVGLAAKAEKEEDIEDLIKGLDDLVFGIEEQNALLQKKGDRRVTEALKKQKQTGGEQATHQEEGANVATIEDLVKEVTELKQRTIKADKVAQFNRLMEKENIPKSYYVRVEVAHDTDVEELSKTVSGDYAEFLKEFNEKELLRQWKPGQGVPKSDEVSKEMKAFIEGRKSDKLI